MGYEVTLYVGNLTDQHGFTDKGKSSNFWFQTIAVIEMCKGCFNVNRNEGTPAFIFGPDGNTIFGKDCYDETLMAIPIQTVIDALKPLVRNQFVRYAWAYKMLKMLSEPGKKYGMRATHCILFGH